MACKFPTISVLILLQARLFQGNTYIENGRIGGGGGISTDGMSTKVPTSTGMGLVGGSRVQL